MKVHHLFMCTVLFGFLMACSTTDTPMPPMSPVDEMPIPQVDENTPDIDLVNWKVTLPIGDPTEIRPPEILDYADNPTLKKYMFNDTEDASLVFFTEPGMTTANSSYSRTELREQMESGSDRVNWTFADGGKMSGTIKVTRVSGDIGELDRIIVMQIHGRLTNEQRDLIGEDDNNAPPVLKIYWDDGKINVRRKILRDLEVNDLDILKKDAWKDESHWFDTEVGFDSFSIGIDVNGNSMTVSLLSHDEVLTFEDIHIDKWSIFENYFKAGNYLQTAKIGAFSEVKFYELNVSH